MMDRTELGKRVAVLVVTAAVVVAIAGVGPLLAPSSDTRQMANPEYDPGGTVVTPVPAEGEIQPDSDAGKLRGVVLIDDSHGNRFSRATLQPFVKALTSTGYRVRFYTGGSLNTELRQADAFVVIDPSSRFTTEEVDTIKRYTDAGGRVLLLGEPDRITVQGGLFSVSLATQESRLTELSSRYGLSLDTEYLYNQERSDTNYKYVAAQPGPGSEVSGVDRAYFYTSAAVRAQGGEVLLRSAEGTHRSGSSDVSDRYPVAVRKNNVVLVGDKTFLEAGRHNVGDNEQFAAYLVEFLVSGSYDGTPLAGENTTTSTDQNATAPVAQ